MAGGRAAARRRENALLFLRPRYGEFTQIDGRTGTGIEQMPISGLQQLAFDFVVSERTQFELRHYPLSGSPDSFGSAHTVNSCLGRGANAMNCSCP